MGSGSLSLTVGQNLPEGQPIKYYGQELNTTTYNLTLMRLTSMRLIAWLVNSNYTLPM